MSFKPQKVSTIKKCGIDNFTFEEANRLFNYNKELGIIEGKSITRNLRSDGYIQIHISGKWYELEHRLIFLLLDGQYPEGEIDHIDGIRSNNKLYNIRKVSRNQNQWNARLRKDSTTGVKGVSWAPREQRWMVRLNVNKKRLYIGYYKTKQEAINASIAARQQHHGEFARHV